MSMARHFRPVELDFAESAPVRLEFSALVAAPPAAVYRALVHQTEQWPEWFRQVTAATPTPEGRTVRLRGGGRFWETVLAAEPDTRYTYRVDRANTPGATALLEDWQLTPADGGSVVRWTVATDGAAVYRTVVRMARPALGRAFRNATRTLERRLVPGHHPPGG
jgi:uncharacterized protein YndB with AHSA1/START domain